MNIKFTILYLIAFWAMVSCTEKVMESSTLNVEPNKTPTLKAASLKYYVTTTGNDANAGTSASPFKTIQKGIDTAVSGDTVVVKDGTYTGASNYFIMFYHGGTSGSPITLKAEHKGGAILDGLNSNGYCIALAANVSYLNISGFEIKNFLWAAFDLNNDGSPNTNITISDNHVHDIGRRCTDSDYGQDGMYLHSSASIIIERNVFHDIGRYSNLEGCSPANANYKNHDHGIYMDGCNGITIRSNIFYNIKGGWALHFYPAASSNISILNNTFDYGSPYQDATHIILAANLTNVQIKNNIFKGQVNYAIFAYIGSYSSVSITNNIAYGGTGGIADVVKSGMTLSGNLTNTDPMIVSSSAKDYHLQSNSPAIDKGVNVGLSGDCLKNSIVGLPDIGAYEYQGQGTGTSTVYYNVQQSGTATKNDCATGSTGSTVTYTVAAGKYSSTVSQSDADTKAINDVNTNKQTYANANGTCTAATVYYNVLESGTATKNDCATGSTGSTVTYTVAAGKYSSTVSQTDANNKAISDVNANKQVYANTNGTCTAPTVYYNTQVSSTAIKNDCPTGSTGSTVTYTVAAGKYSSTVSQTDANNKAAADLSANAQSYANSNGTCTAPTVYYNVQESGSATKNDCGTGYTGSSVTYTVSANTYTSTASQTDADNKAIATVNNNKQAYANANGTCTPITVTAKRGKKWWNR